MRGCVCAFSPTPLPPFVDEVFSEKKWRKTINEMGGNILGGNFLTGNFPVGSLMGGNFPGENFPEGNFTRTVTV